MDQSSPFQAVVLGVYAAWIVALRYEIEDGVLVLGVTAGGFGMLRDVLDTAAADPAARPKMPLLIDVRSQPASFHNEVIRWRPLILSEMREQFGPRWAILAGTGPVRVGVMGMFAAFSQIEGLEVGLFADKHAAITWLRR